MNRLIPGIIIALIAGGIAGYNFRGETSTQKPESSESSMDKTEAQDPKEEKIKNALSAAPDSVSKEATVLDWPEKEGAEMATLQKGTNDWTCLPDYLGSPGNDPICVDKQAMLWFGAYMTKEEPQLAQAGLGYMLQGGSDASNTDPFAEKPAEGEDWVSAPPHIMIFPAADLDPVVYGTDHKSGNPWIMWSGTPYEHLMIPVK